MIATVALAATLVITPVCSQSASDETAGVVAGSAEMLDMSQLQLPVVRKRPAPRFPVKLRWRGSGKVVLRAVIDTEGRVSDVCVLDHKGPQGFIDPAAHAVRKWRYEPARLNGEPISVFYTVVVNFSAESSRWPGFYEPVDANDPISPWHPAASRPKPLTRQTPQFPENARREHRSGQVVLKFVICPDGTVRNATVVRSIGGDDFGQAALAAVKTWTYEPARYAGHPQAVFHSLRLNFEPDPDQPITVSIDEEPSEVSEDEP